MKKKICWFSCFVNGGDEKLISMIHCTMCGWCGDYANRLIFRGQCWRGAIRFCLKFWTQSKFANLTIEAIMRCGMKSFVFFSFSNALIVLPNTYERITEIICHVTSSVHVAHVKIIFFQQPSTNVYTQCSFSYQLDFCNIFMFKNTGRSYVTKIVDLVIGATFAFCFFIWKEESCYRMITIGRKMEIFLRVTLKMRPFFNLQWPSFSCFGEIQMKFKWNSNFAPNRTKWNSNIALNR